MKKVLFFILLLVSLNVSSQIGINTSTPQKTLHVNGSLQVVNELNVGGNSSTPGSPGKKGQVLMSNGPFTPPKWEDRISVPVDAVGTVIMVDGKFKVAQEISVQMSQDFTAGGNNVPTPIGYLTNVIIDNEKKYFSNEKTNSFTVVEDGVYQVTMNCQLSTKTDTFPVVGIWDKTKNRWVARVNDLFTAKDDSLQTYTLIASIPLLASHVYSFYVLNYYPVTIRHLSYGSTGSGPITQLSLKRLK